MNELLDCVGLGLRLLLGLSETITLLNVNSRVVEMLQCYKLKCYHIFFIGMKLE